MSSPMPVSVNFHLWRPCNMSCNGCFARFQDLDAAVLPGGHMSKQAAIDLAVLLGRQFDKVTFVGGEPTLCPWLPLLIERAHLAGATTMMVSNGTRLTSAYLDGLARSLDWVALSIDSAVPATHVSLGRAVHGEAISPERYLAIADDIRRLGMRLKINTVVSALNAVEDMRELILALRPERWKVFQVLPVDGQNDGDVEPLLINSGTFQRFLDRHGGLNALGIPVVGEDNEDMTGSYAMVDPAGRFFDNSTGRHTYSRPILKVGIEAAWSEITFNAERFAARGAVYSW